MKEEKGIEGKRCGGGKKREKKEDEEERKGIEWRGLEMRRRRGRRQLLKDE